MTEGSCACISDGFVGPPSGATVTDRCVAKSYLEEKRRRRLASHPPRRPWPPLPLETALSPPVSFSTASLSTYPPEP
jgi:hypothetical protein